jgi:hypothetical protein
LFKHLYKICSLNVFLYLTIQVNSFNLVELNKSEFLLQFLISELIFLLEFSWFISLFLFIISQII